MYEDLFQMLFLFVLGTGGFFWGFTRLRRERKIENIPTSTIRSLALGLVELVGKAKKTKPLLSPFNKAECVFYRYSIERYQSSGRSGNWIKIAGGDSTYSPFWLDDGTGKILVLPDKAELILSKDYEFQTGWKKSLPLELINFMNEHNLKYRGLFGTYRLRFREWYICEDESVYILGTAKKQPDPLGYYREKTANRLEELKQDPQRLSEFDLNKDGEISKEEWNFAVKKIEQNILEEELESNSIDDLADVVITQGDTEKIFILSDRSQKDLVSKLHWQTLLGIFGGAILALIAVWAFIGKLLELNFK